MNQLGAMVRYEFLMAWRRRSLVILWVLLLVGILSFALLMRDVNERTPVYDEVSSVLTGADAPEWAQGIDPLVASHTITLGNLMIAGMIFYTVGVVLLMAEVIPLDRQFKVRELLDALPLSRATYLAGKIVSMWAGLLVGALLIGLIAAPLVWLILGAYDLRVFAALWIALLVPQSFVASALTMLAASFVGSRRAAVMVGLVAMPFVLVLSFTTVISFAGVGALIEPIYAVSILLQPGAETNAVIVERIGDALVAFVGITATAWLGVWAWGRVRE